MTALRWMSLLYSPASKVGRLYWRELPGGGYVALDVVEEPAHAGGYFVGTITVERRADAARRKGCSPPIIAEARAPTSGSLVHHLLPIARSNPAIGSAILRLETATANGTVTDER
jgi:hypothetical protein